MKVLKAAFIVLLIAAGLPMAQGHAPEDRLPSPTLGRRAEFANVSLPAVITSSDEIEINLVLGIPYGCYKPDVGVEHRDEFTHVLRPVLLDEGHRCSRPTSLDFQKLSLGYCVWVSIKSQLKTLSKRLNHWVSGSALPILDGDFRMKKISNQPMKWRVITHPQWIRYKNQIPKKILRASKNESSSAS